MGDTNTDLFGGLAVQIALAAKVLEGKCLCVAQWKSLPTHEADRETRL
jgi:hypothetical protein